MKVTQPKPKFEPITLVLESQLEAEIFCKLLGSIDGQNSEVAEAIIDGYHDLVILGICPKNRSCNIHINSEELNKAIIDSRG